MFFSMTRILLLMAIMSQKMPASGWISHMPVLCCLSPTASLGFSWQNKIESTAVYAGPYLGLHKFFFARLASYGALLCVSLGFV